ncbi:MAG: hypothetical protein ACYC0C_12480 [Devosia sp.]
MQEHKFAIGVVNSLPVEWTLGKDDGPVSREQAATGDAGIGRVHLDEEHAARQQEPGDGAAIVVEVGPAGGRR